MWRSNVRQSKLQYRAGTGEGIIKEQGQVRICGDVGMDIRFSICICTKCRPGVVETVRSVFAQKGVALSELEIIVADDDPCCSAREELRRIAEFAPVPVRYVESGAQNISACRNACLNAAKADWIIFVDDDQVLEPNWLQQMVITSKRYRADAVKCYVRGLYPPDTPDWVKAGGPYTYDYGPTGTEVHSGATCGILFRRNLPGSRELLFDVALGKTGGEDAEFFMRYKAIGGKIVSCRDAVAHEVVTSKRVTKTYLLRKCRRHGHIHGRIALSKKRPVGRSFSVLKSVIGAIVTSPYRVVRLFHPALSCRMFMKFWCYVGMIDWALGRTAFHYE